VLTALQLSTLCHAKGITLGDWLDRSFQPFPQKLVNVTVQSQVRRKEWSSCEPLMAAINSAEESMGSDGRVLVRASGTEPLVRVMVEAAEASLVEHWADHLASVVDQCLNAA
jgi:phosphoglucosamine mutase